MTVQELIDELMKVKDKSMEVVYLDTNDFDSSTYLKIRYVEEENDRIELTDY